MVQIEIVHFQSRKGKRKHHYPIYKLKVHMGILQVISHYLGGECNEK